MMFNNKTKSKANTTMEESKTQTEALIKFYKNNIFKTIGMAIAVLLFLIAGSLILNYALRILVFNQAWFIILAIIILIYTFLKPGLYYILERKKEMIDGFFTFIEDYITVADDLAFSAFVDGIINGINKMQRYPKLFVNEFLIPLSIKMKTEYSTIALKEMLEIPRNNYYEIQKFNEFILNTLESNDKSLRQALKMAITTANEGKKRYYDKLASTSFVKYMAMGFMFAFPLMFMFMFLTSFSSSSVLPGISHTALKPSSGELFSWFICASLGATLLEAIINYYTGKEGKAVANSYLILIIMFVVCIGIFGMVTVI